MPFISNEHNLVFSFLRSLISWREFLILYVYGRSTVSFSVCVINFATSYAVSDYGLDDRGSIPLRGRGFFF
jgi:hypothetical protein